MFNFSVIDGIYGNKGEVGMPGSFGYDGFPGEFNFLRRNYFSKHWNIVLMLYLNVMLYFEGLKGERGDVGEFGEVGEKGDEGK